LERILIHQMESSDGKALKVTDVSPSCVKAMTLRLLKRWRLGSSKTEFC